MSAAPRGRLTAGSWIEELTARVRRHGYAVVRGANGTRQTCGLELSVTHPELILDQVDPAAAREILRLVRAGRRLKPGIYTILRFDLRVQSLTLQEIREEMPVQHKLLDGVLRALRVQHAYPPTMA